MSGCAFNKEAITQYIPMIPKETPKQHEAWVPAKTQRVWVNPTVDETGALVAGHYKQVVVEPGHWVLQDTLYQGDTLVK